jgi:hypothetical protein
MFVAGGIIGKPQQRLTTSANIIYSKCQELPETILFANCSSSVHAYADVTKTSVLQSVDSGRLQLFQLGMTIADHLHADRKLYTTWTNCRWRKKSLDAMRRPQLRSSRNFLFMLTCYYGVVDCVSSAWWTRTAGQDCSLALKSFAKIAVTWVLSVTYWL